MPDRILIDSGPLIALFDNSDSQHQNIKKFLNKQQYQFISTLAVFTEVSHMLDFSIKAQQDFYTWVMHKGIIIADIN